MLYDPMKDYDEVGRTLLKAAKYMDEHGHCKGTLENSKGAVCAYGALNTALFGQADITSREWDVIHQNSPEQMILETQCTTALLDETDDLLISTWNDEPDRTKEQVIDLFKRAAEKHKVTA